MNNKKKQRTYEQKKWIFRIQKLKKKNFDEIFSEHSTEVTKILYSRISIKLIKYFN